MFVVEDEAHSEPRGEYSTLEDAMAELRRRAALPWDAAPNLAPCTSWKSCGRRYEVIEYDADQAPWRELRRFLVLEVSASGATWAVSPTLDGRGGG
jgi:hypothetical protein